MPNRLREIRKDRGLSMEALGAKCVPKATKTQISKLERGINQMTQQWQMRLARVRHCHPAELLGNADALKPGEVQLLDTYRGLAEDNRETVKRILDAFKRPEEPEASQG